MMNFVAPSLLPAFAEIVILLFACIALLASVFGKRYASQWPYLLVQLSLIVVTVWTILQLGQPMGVSFGGLFVNDDIARLLKIFIYISAFGSFYYSRLYIEQRMIPRGEYYVLGAFSTLGMMILASAHSFITIYLGLELFSLALYAMVALRRDDAIAIEASMKYFIMGAVASGMMLYGMSMIYGATGSMDISIISYSMILVDGTQTLIFAFALVFLIAGIAFKLAGAPFHMWAPDVYTGAPSSVTVFLSTGPKIAALGMALRLLVFALPSLFDNWQELLIIISVFSIVIGNIFAIAQMNIKRMLAYSAIANIGYMLLGLVAGTQEGYASALFYILIYSLMSLAAFGMVVLLSKTGFEAEKIDDFKGLNARSPWLAFLVLLVMFSLAGIPPTVGFFAKFFVIKAIVDVNIIWLAVVALLFAAIGAFYYIRIVKVMYFDNPEDTSAVSVSKDLQVAISINAVVLLLLGIYPPALQALISACRVAFGL